MIQFTIVSPIPSDLNQALIQTLGRILGIELRVKKKKTIGVRFVSEKEIQRLNKFYRQRDKPTDVLSFGIDPSPVPSEEMGDLAICPAYAKHEAKRRGISLKEELVRLLIHGTLHLFGYDHATEMEEQKMFALQERCVERVLMQV